jgi:hypothetical protein
VPPEGVKRQRTRTDGGEVDGGRRNQSANTHQARGKGGGCAHPWTCPGRLRLILLELGRLAEDRLCGPGDGTLAGFREADKFVIGALNAKFNEGSTSTRAGTALAAGRRSFYRFVDLGYDDALTASFDELRRMFEGA